MENKILRLPGVCAMTGLSRASIYREISRRQFPKPVHLTSKVPFASGDPTDAEGRAVGWLASEIIDWIEDRVRRARGGVSE